MNKIKDILFHLLKPGYETEVVEFKEAKNQYDFNKLGKYFSALSNEANLLHKDYAWLVFGIRDADKAFVNTRFRIIPKKLNNLKSEISNHTTNAISFIDIYELFIDDNRVLMFKIPAAPQGIPVAWKGHYYGRAGEELQALNLEEIERIRKQALDKDWSARIIPEAGINDLSEEAIKKSREFFKTKNPKLKEEVDKWDDITFLNKAKVTIKGKITRTAILLLGKPEAEHYLNPASAKITWILKDRDNIEKDYEHFACPLLLNVEKVYHKIRNLKYRYIADGTLFPDEMEQYDPFIIREALNNCIAHQDYTLGGKINVVENEDGYLIFVNAGDFIPGSVEEVIFSNAPEHKYRNKFLTEAMVNLNMIDTIGSGIRKMFIIQKNKYFPLPEYNFSHNKITLTITGKVLDMDYARKLAHIKDLSLREIYLLDKVSKRKPLTDEEIKILKKKKLIEGRKPNLYISDSIAKITGEKASYIKHRGFKDQYYKKLILEFIEKYGLASKKDIDDLILDILPSVLSIKQKKNKIKNIIYAMSKKDRSIINVGTNRYPKWKLNLSKK